MTEEQERVVPGEVTETEEQRSLVEDILIETLKIDPKDEFYGQRKEGLKEFLKYLTKPDKKVERVSKADVDEMIAEIDKTLSLQLDAILHNPVFQNLESAWRSLHYLVEKTDFRENNRLAVLNVSKEDLLDDFEAELDITKTGLYNIVYSKEFGQFGGKPYAAMIGNYEFGYGPQDIKLLQKVASVAAMSHAPFIAAASPTFFGIDDYNGLEKVTDLDAKFEGHEYIKWRSFRDSEDSRHVALTMPRFSLRLPYGPDTLPVKAFNYEENVSASHEHYLWGNTAFTFASRLTDSFAKYRWCANITGPLGGGAVEDLPVHQYKEMGEIQTKPPTEVLIPDRRDFELSEQGFISLCMRKDSDNAAFFSANSTQRPKEFRDKDIQTNFKLGTKLPYLIVVNRLAHYLKVIQRENIGTWKERSDLEKELNKWISQYVVDQDNVSARIRSEKPLRKAKVMVKDIEGDPGWYKVELQVRPHFKYEGAYFDLSLVGKLDKQ